MRWYLDASVALHALLPGGQLRARDWIDRTYASGDEIYSSSLLNLELARVLRREQLDLALARPVLDRIHLISINDGVLRFAAAIEAHIRSLDAIHLATCLLMGGNVTVVTHDTQMAQVAAGLGLATLDPLSD